MLKNARLMPELDCGGRGRGGALSFIENVRGEKKLGSFSTDIREPRTATAKVKCFLFWRGFSPYHGKEKFLLMTVA